LNFINLLKDGMGFTVTNNVLLEIGVLAASKNAIARMMALVIHRMVLIGF
jgi:hypothetical protein